jgi:hypothetical protein
MASPDPLFFFGHGLKPPSGPLGQDKVPAIDHTCGHLLKDRLVCAICCHSAPALAHCASQHRVAVTVLGFKTALRVMAGEDEECLAPYDAYISDCVLAGLEELLAGRPAEAARKRMQDEFFRVAAELGRGLTFSPEEMPFILAYDAFVENADAIDLVGDCTRCM